MVFQLPSAALAGLQPNPSAEGAWGCLWLTAQQADPMARSNLSCATTAPRGTGSGRLGFSEALLALEIMTKSVLCVFNSNLPRTPWGILKFFCCSLVFWSTMIILPCSYHGDQRSYWFDSLGWFLFLAFMEKCCGSILLCELAPILTGTSCREKKKNNKNSCLDFLVPFFHL